MALVCYDLPVLPYGPDKEFRVLRYSLTLHGLLIPRGFVWDGASIPAVAQAVVGKPWACKYQRASLLHDYVYVTHKATRLWADDRFHELMLLDGASTATAYACWLAVRAFGGSRWASRGNHRILSETHVRSLERAFNNR